MVVVRRASITTSTGLLVLLPKINLMLGIFCNLTLPSDFDKKKHDRFEERTRSVAVLERTI